jgi:APA family basic amino acid/polyamine antiporter
MEYIQLDHIRYLEEAIAVGLLLALSGLHGTLVKAGTSLQNLTVAAKALFILVFVGFGMYVMPEPTDTRLPLEVSWWAWPVNLMWVSLSFTGFNSAIYVAEECQDPRRDIPKALVLGTVVTAVLYLAINSVFLFSAPLSHLAGSPEIALVSASALGGEPLRRAVQALVLLSLFTLISGMAVAGPRVAVKMGEDGYLPPLSLKNAALIQCALAVFMTLRSGLVDQLTYLSLTLSLTAALTVACVFRLPAAERPHPFFPIFFLTGTLLAAAAGLKTLPAAGLAALVTIASGGIVYYLFFGKRSSTREPFEGERTEETTT